MTVFKRFFITLALLVVCLTPVHAADDADPLNARDVFKYLDQSMAWYRDVTGRDSIQTHSREVLLCNSLRNSALKALRLSFDFARIEAEILEAQQLGPQPPPADMTTSDESSPNLAQIKITVQGKVTDIEGRQKENDAALRKAPAAQRATLQAKRDKIAMELTLAQAQMDLINTVMGLASDNQDNSLSAQINNLAVAIPELDKKKKTDTTTTANGTTTVEDKSSANPLASMISIMAPNTGKDDSKSADSKGIIGLSSDVLGGIRQKQDLSELLANTKTMQDINKDMLGRLRAELISVVKRANTLGQEVNEATAILSAQTQELDTLTGQFKAVGKGIVPLSEQRKVLESASRSLTEWQKLYNEQIQDDLQKLFFRLLGLAIAIIVPFALSEAARRFTIKYVRDARRRRQLSIIRRAVVAIMVGIIILLNLVTEFGSLATVIGFITAGVAVALQNVILSVVAYFFFFGRFGIKVGSRVTVYGTTGDVIETGLVRLYLMEMTEENDQYRPTGRIVAFPNSIIFQPTAFFKQVPGVNYRWHEITFLLEAGTDRAIANQKLHEAVESIHADNHGMIEMQKAALEQSAHYSVKEPRPEGRLDDRGTEGLAFIIRYPIDVEHAEQTDKNVTQQILDIFEREPSVKRANTNPPAIRQH